MERKTNRWLHFRQFFFKFKSIFSRLLVDVTVSFNIVRLLPVRPSFFFNNNIGNYYYCGFNS
jgi:hypothetical protein